MRGLVTLFFLVGLVACGGDSAISGSASARLIPQVEAVRAAATSGDSTAAHERLAELRQSVADLRQAGQISEQDAAKVLAASAAVEAQLPTLAAIPTTIESGGRTAETTTTLSKAKPNQNEEEQDQSEEDRNEPEQKHNEGEGKGKDR